MDSKPVYNILRSNYCFIQGYNQTIFFIYYISPNHSKNLVTLKPGLYSVRRSTQTHTCQPGRGQMTEIFPIGGAHALTGNGRRACTTQSVTAVAHLNIILVSHIMPHRGKDVAFSDILIADLRTYVKQLILSER